MASQLNQQSRSLWLRRVTDTISQAEETDAGDNHHRPLASSTPWSKSKGDVSLEQSMAKSIQAAIESSSSCITKSMLKIEPCVPATGSSYLSMVEWKRWKALLSVTLSTVPGLSEAEKKVTFLRSAGSCLLDILESIPETIGETLNPFTSTIEALDTYFGSEACIRLARLTFKEISQIPNESNVDFIARLMKAIKGCNYSEDYMEDHLMDMIARKSSDVDIRKETQTYDRSSGKRCSYNQLREFALQLESIRRMEREHTSNARKLSGVNAVEPQSSNEASRDSYTQKREKGWLASRDPSRARHSNTHQQDRGASSKQRECDCCGSWNHAVRDCHQTWKTCNSCGRAGHLSRKCPRSVLKRDRSPTRFSSAARDNRKAKVQAIDEESNEVDN